MIASVSLAIGAVAASSMNAVELPSAVYCLTHGNIRLLPHVPGAKYAVTYAHANTTVPGEHNLLLFVKRERHRHDAFVIVVSGRVFDVQNNATLKTGRDGVSYVNDPLGGIWTHDFIAANFAKALKQGPLIVSVDRLPTPSPICRQFGTRASTR
jgi:hypothetical protein